MFTSRLRQRVLIGTCLLALAGCGAGGTPGGGSGGPTGQGLVLASFRQANLDNVPISEILRFDFSEAVDPSTVNVGTFQIREGPAFGVTSRGSFVVDGATVFFEPELPGDCGLVGAGLRPDTRYRITILGAPEEFAVRNTVGQPLERTQTVEFRTLDEDDPDVLRDQVPGDAPRILATTPPDRDAAVDVGPGDEIVVELSENLDPCTVRDDTVRCLVTELGDPATRVTAPNGNVTGFSPAEDGAESPYTWGAQNAVTVLPTPQRIPVHLQLVQDFERTRILVRPMAAGGFPENALVVVELRGSVLDFGGHPLSPTTFAFTTANLAPTTSTLDIAFDGSTPIEDLQTTADVNTARAPGRAQGFLLFTGDGDNGPDSVSPSYPVDSTTCGYRPNGGSKTVFDPVVNTVLDTGSSRSACANQADGSTAVVWEFESLRIRSGVTVNIVGVNPAILLVQNEILIESGGVLRLRGTAGSRGGVNRAGDGGSGVAGGGYGGAGGLENSASDYAGDGSVGFGSDDYDTPAEIGGLGAGRGGVDATYLRSPLTANQLGNSGGGGGGGHANRGAGGQTTPGNVNPLAAAPDSGGGSLYVPGEAGDRMRFPSAGAGAGGSGSNYATDQGSTSYTAGGSGGGGGGGFVDLTCGGTIRIHGTIDVSGGAGALGAVDTFGYGASGGGGGGSGGGIRILTPADIDLTGGALLAGGGSGGAGITQTGNGWATPSGPQNAGGDGSNGRIVLEDGDSVITGIATATVIPGEGQDGFYRNTFDAARFEGGARSSRAVTGLVLLGPLASAEFVTPVVEDFDAGAPTAGSPPAGETAILVEAQGHPLLPDGTAGTPATGWITIGYCRSTGTPSALVWVSGSYPPDVGPPTDTAGVGIHQLDGSGYVQVRLTFYVSAAAMPADPGPFLERWRLRFRHDQ